MQAVRLRLGLVEQSGEPLGHEDLSWRRARAGDARSATQLRFEVAPHGARIGTGPFEQSGYEPLGLVEERQQQVLAVDLGVAESQRLGLGVVQGLL